MFITELRREQVDLRGEFSNYTDSQIILSWLTEKIIDPYDPETEGAYEELYISPMEELDEQDKMMLVSDLLFLCSKEHYWYKRQLASYIGNSVDLEPAFTMLNTYVSENLMMIFLEFSGLKDDFLTNKTKHTYFGCVFTWLITIKKHVLCELDIAIQFGYSNFFDMDMWTLSYQKYDDVLAIMKIIYRNDIPIFQLMISEVNKIKNGFISIEDVNYILMD